MRQPVKVASQMPDTITVRRVSFDYRDVPAYWAGGRPFLTQVGNVLHLVLPAGERWFVRLCREALPQIEDEKLRAEVKGFMGQESVHGRSHQAFVDKMEAEGFPAQDLMDKVERRMNRFAERLPLVAQASIIAGIEQYTAVLGRFAFETDLLDDAHPTMRDLLLWHGAEEVEHKAVAFDLFTALGGGYLRRLVGMFAATTGLMISFPTSLAGLLGRDRRSTRRQKLDDWRDLRRNHESPFKTMAMAFAAYLRPSFHPSQEGDISVAAEYLAQSPAVQAFEAAHPDRPSIPA